MKLEAVLRVARAYASLGDAICQQVDRAVSHGERPTPGACEYISDRLIPELHALTEEAGSAEELHGDIGRLLITMYREEEEGT